MFKFIKDDNLKHSLYLLIVVLISIIFYRATENLHILDMFPVVFGVLSPFIIGIIFAYIRLDFWRIRYLQNCLNLKRAMTKKRLK